MVPTILSWASFLVQEENSLSGEEEKAGRKEKIDGKSVSETQSQEPKS